MCPDGDDPDAGQRKFKRQRGREKPESRSGAGGDQR